MGTKWTEEELEEMDNTPHYCCGDCRYYNSNSGCKRRIDHGEIKFTKPWFKSYDGHQHNGIPCCDFEPSEIHVWGKSHWTGWNDYWTRYVKYWLPYGNTNRTVGFTLFGDESVRYNVTLMDFVNGTMMAGDKLKAVSKTYYRKAGKSPTGYQLVTEEIDGVRIPRRELEKQ